MLKPIERVVATAFAGLAGYALGGLGAFIANGDGVPQRSNYAFLAESFPLPHHVAKYPGGLSFRFAMARDVIHERFPRHGPAYYRERNRLAGEKLAAQGPEDAARLALYDDLAAGLERLGRSSEAVTVMRDKLRRQRALGVAGRGLYTSYANLGTFLIHANFKQAIAGDRAAKTLFREGLGFVHKSVEVNPEAHFGRERWQSAIAEFFLAAIDDPRLLTTFDCLGNRLDLGMAELLNREANVTVRVRPADLAFRPGKADDEVPAFFASPHPFDELQWWPSLQAIRTHITKVGAENGWEAVPVRSHRAPVAFDEPALGIIGMWRQGGGANPHFALALGETMLRVGQRDIAWAAFERAGRIADRYWPDPALQQFLRDHCRKRQSQIDESLRSGPSSIARPPVSQHGSPSPPEPRALADNRRANFEAGLAVGEAYQRAYQDYERQKLAAGRSLADDHLFDEFHATHPPIATPVGPEEWFVHVARERIEQYTAQRRKAWGMFVAGFAALGTALLLRRKARSARARTKQPLAGFPGVAGDSAQRRFDPTPADLEDWLRSVEGAAVQGSDVDHPPEVL